MKADWYRLTMSSSTSNTPTHTATDIIGYTLDNRRYLNVTNRCTLRCRFCPKFNDDWIVRGYSMRMQAEPSVAQMVTAVGDAAHWDEVVFCGFGEPTLRLPEVLAVCAAIRKQAKRIRINTDGLANRIYGRDVTPELSGLVDALSISLNAGDAETYNRWCRPRHDDAFLSLLEFTKQARLHVPDVTLTAIDGLDGVDINACEQIAQGLGVKFRCRYLGRVG